MRQEVDCSSRPPVTGRRVMGVRYPLVSDQRFPDPTLFTLAVRHWSQVSSWGHLYSPHPRDWAKKTNFACHGLISLPDTLNFVANLPSLLPDVVTCRQMFVILNSYRRLCRNDYSSVTKLRKSAGGLLSDFYNHRACFSIRYALSVLKHRFKKNWADPSLQYVRSHSI